MQRSLMETALAAHAAGMYVIPPREDGSKAPLFEGDHWAARGDAEKIKRWYANGRQGVGVATGKASGNVELFEFDDAKVYDEFKEAAHSVGLWPLCQRIEEAYLERTPGGGVHWLYRCDTELKSGPLAQRPRENGKPKPLIETKGNGGYAIIAPSGGTVHATGRSYEVVRGAIERVATITEEERTQLRELARLFDEMPERGILNEQRPPRDLDASKPGNDYCNRTSWQEILEPHGWHAVYQRGSITYWRRPGKRIGVSASTNYADSDLLYVWSTSTEFEALRGYNKFSAYALLNHNSDFHAAARQLASEGYGAAPQVIIGKRSNPEVSEYIPRFDDIPEVPALTDTWVDCYCDYAAKVSPMTPRPFHESAALWLISTAIARRLCVPMPFATIYPNIWVLWLAPTTLYRKSTAMDIAKGIARRVFPHLLMAHEMTAEGFLSDMAGYEPTNLEKLTQEQKERWMAGRNYAAQKGLILDEASGLLAGAGRDYNAGLLEALMRFFDCDTEYVRTTRGQGIVIVRNASLSILGASTPAAMAAHLISERLWSMGWWPRFGIVTAPDERPEWREPTETKEPYRLISDLRRLYERLPESQWLRPAGALYVQMDDDATTLWRAYNKTCSYDSLDDSVDGRLYGTYGRLPTMAIKVATLFAAMDWADEYDRPFISRAHLERATVLLDQWRVGAHRAIIGASRAEDDIAHRRVLKQLSIAGTKGVSLRELGKALRDVKPGSILVVIEQLIRMGEVEKVVQKHDGAGRPKELYRLVTE